MLTGDTQATSGQAIITIPNQKTTGGSRLTGYSVGYCPQVEALLGPLTGRQHLNFFSRLKGLPSAQIKKEVEWALSKLNLSKHADKPVWAYSGGNKRKLSVAIALLARPALILLVTLFVLENEPDSDVKFRE